MTEIVVIGGGIAGAAVALALAERGMAVNVVEAERPGSAATGASAGMLAPQYESAGPGPLFTALVQARAALPRFAAAFEELAGHGIGLRWDGMLVANLTEEEERAAQAMIRWQLAEGQQGAVLDVPAAQRLQPGIATDVRSYLWLPDEGQLDAQRLAELLPAALAAAGVRVITGRRAAAVRATAGHVTGVALEDGRAIAADVVVLAAGAWSGTIGGLPGPVPVRPVRGHMLRYAGGAADLHRIVSSHAGRYLVPRSDGSILAGSTMDETGFDRSIDEAGLQAVHTAAGRLLPALGMSRPVERWADLRPISADGMPIIGRDPELDGLYHATGYGRNGILIGPLAGQLLAGLIVGGDMPGGWHAFGPQRLGSGAASPAERS
jgi:glycine oxidase